MGRVLPVTAWYWYHSTTGSLDLTTARDADPTGGLTLFLPVHDGDLISAQPVDAVRQGASATVDLLIGTNSQEMNFYYVSTGVLNLIDSDEKVCASIGGRHPQPEKLVAAYRASRPGASSGELFSAIMTDWMFSRLSELIAYAQQLLAEMDIQGSSIGYVGELLFNNSGYFLNGCSM